MKVPFSWDLIGGDLDNVTYRAKVESGWLVKVITTFLHQPSIVTTTFVPDPQHNWEIEEEQQPVDNQYGMGGCYVFKKETHGIGGDNETLPPQKPYSLE